MIKAFTVLQVNRYIKGLLEDDALLRDLQVEGELSNFKQHSSGHVYFTLKDAQASINCIMFASYTAGIDFDRVKNGEKVVIDGHVSLYEKTGQYQFYVVSMKLVGEGDLAAAFIRLRDALKLEGLFEPSRKKEIPKWVDSVALVTSPTGAALQDMIKVIRSRNPGVKIFVVPALVQGQQAPDSIARAIQLVNELKPPRPDVIILGRGGGSMEDLQAFNEEIVARAITESQVPIISAVGHETDFTIADFVADYRSPTPSAAGVAAVADVSEQFLRVDILRKRADRAINRACDAARAKVLFLVSRPCFTCPQEAVTIRQIHVEQLTKDMERLINLRLNYCKTTLENRIQLLEAISPYALWKRGYGAVCSKEGIGIKTVADLHPGQEIVVHLQDGEASAQVMDVIQKI